MIISPRHGFVFVHVPKCAGTSVRTQITACDPDHVAMAEPGDHPVLGPIDYGHVPLSQLRRHFPAEYAQLQTLTSFAVIRDPLPRFGSSLRQMLWRYEKTPMTLIPPDTLRARTLEIIERVRAEIDAPGPQTIFFARQTDFVFDEGRRLIDHLVPIEHVGAFLAFLSQKTGTPMDSDRRSNQNVDLRLKWLGPAAYRMNDILRRRLPLGLHARIKDAALGLLARKTSAAESSGLLDMPELRAFVAEAYAGDAALYAQARAEAPALLARFADASLPLGPKTVTAG
ncbi:Sulfotransferase family protein [Rhodovulum sp. ES.010]|uniref:sulfotransferase family 2 domain-containing protein n=1 Tax=Rhodovulum sp. ES.010 TaxID=1882821 RepID=UPI00092BDBA5|nr:sulfotransferase family 2 domain-containing protein [Rhodovulum sp. ES.010]SIO59874.1 Sulfotransferase family protein [Rhodovulum sp. ES.010]